jgi:hypothetical protein
MQSVNQAKPTLDKLVDTGAINPPSSSFLYSACISSMSASPDIKSNMHTQPESNAAEVDAGGWHWKNAYLSFPSICG